MSENSQSAVSFGIISIIFGALALGVQLLGGLCCGWIGWPLVVVAIICALMTIGGNQTAKTYGLIGAFLSIIGIIIQLLVLSGSIHGLTR